VACPYDLLEDLLTHSGAWKQVMPFLAPYEDVATGRPITASAWRPCRAALHRGPIEWCLRPGRQPSYCALAIVKHVTTFIEHDEENEIVHHRERWRQRTAIGYAMEER